MALTINFPDNLEQKIINEAKLRGLSIDNYLSQLIKKKIEPQTTQTVQSIDKDKEAELLKKIKPKLNIPEKEWSRYRQLIKLREAETLTELEYLELISISDRVEFENAERLKHLFELSKLRGVSLPQVMDDLGIKPVKV